MNSNQKRILIVGGVAGGTSCAARARGLCEACKIVIFERGPPVSFANCGLHEVIALRYRRKASTGSMPRGMRNSSRSAPSIIRLELNCSYRFNV